MTSNSEENGLRSADGLGADGLGGLPEILGMQLREARRVAGIDQGTVARRLGVLQSAVSRVENGRRLPSVEFIERYARAIGGPVEVRFGAAGMAEQTVRRERAKRALVWAYDYGGEWNKDRMFSRDLLAAFEESCVEDPTSVYLRLLEDAVGDLGPYVEMRHRFKTAVAFASACCEVIDWKRVRVELAERRGRPRRDQMRSVHHKVVQRVWDVVVAADEGRRCRPRP